MTIYRRFKLLVIRICNVTQLVSRAEKKITKQTFEQTIKHDNVDNVTINICIS